MTFNGVAIACTNAAKVTGPRVATPAFGIEEATITGDSTNPLTNALNIKLANEVALGDARTIMLIDGGAFTKSP